MHDEVAPASGREVRVRLSPVETSELVSVETCVPDLGWVLEHRMVPIADVPHPVDRVEIFGSVPREAARRELVARARSVVAWSLDADETRRLWSVATASHVELRGCAIPPDLPRDHPASGGSLGLQNCVGFDRSNLSPADLTVHLPFDGGFPASARQSIFSLFLRGGPSPLGAFDRTELARMPRLDGLYVSKALLRGEDLRDVLAVPTKRIDLHTALVDGGGGHGLRGNPRLRWLSVVGTRLEPSVYGEVLARCRNLEHLDLGVASLDARLLRAVAEHPTLRSLGLRDVEAVTRRPIAIPRVRSVVVSDLARGAMPAIRRLFPAAEIGPG